MSSSTMRVAAVQLTSGADKAHNLDVAAVLIAEAVTDGAELVVLPELMNCLGPGRVQRAGAEPFDGPTTRWAQRVARRHGIWLHAGSFIEERADASRSNTSVVISPEGVVAGSYRKVHLFDCDVPDAVFRESEITDPGDELTTVPLGTDVPDTDTDTVTDCIGPLAAHDLPAPVLGLSICYDLRFPELYRILALRGATILVVPAAFTARTGPPHWEVLLRARAIENQCFVIAAGQAGVTPPDLAWHGHSMIIDPWGTVLVEATTNGPEVVVADLSMHQMEETRALLPSLASRRPTAYRWPPTG